MLQNTSKTLGFKKTMVFKTPPAGWGDKLYMARDLLTANLNSIFATSGKRAKWARTFSAAGQSF